VVFSPSTLVRGGTFTAYVTIRNSGEAAGSAGSLRVWMNRFASATAGEPGDRDVAAGAFAVGESRTIAIGGLVAPTANGTYTFRAFVDADGAVAEQSEGNNQKTKTFGFY
jgi:subtilase family serine protease